MNRNGKVAKDALRILSAATEATSIRLSLCKQEQAISTILSLDTHSYQGDVDQFNYAVRKFCEPKWMLCTEPIRLHCGLRHRYWCWRSGVQFSGWSNQTKCCQRRLATAVMFLRSYKLNGQTLSHGFRRRYVF